MSGHVFHPGHQALHGVTVVVETTGGRTYVGRFDTEDEQGVHLLDAGVHDAATAALPKDDYLRRTLKFGVRTEQKHVVIRSRDVSRITPLSQMTA
jgi:hypothetical protein